MIFTNLANFVLRVVIYSGLVLPSLWLLWTYPLAWLAIHLASCGWLIFMARAYRVDRVPATTKPVQALSHVQTMSSGKRRSAWPKLS